ncbi:MAG: alpha/beta hydrolase [Promethearchaeota archaeon]
MKLRKLKKNERWFILFAAIMVASAVVGHLLQNDFGSIHIQTIKIVDENGYAVIGKLYRPIGATQSNPLPGVLLLHGFNNDKDTEAPAALELARRGFVALSLSQLGHGDSDGQLSLAVFTDPSMTLGANASYQYLKNLPFVDASNTGLIGHSMGGSVAIQLAITNSDHRAIVIQAGGPLNLTETGELHNYLNTWPLYEELFSIQDRTSFLADGLAMIEYNTGETGKVDTTYGNFTAGTAQRYALCEATHPGGTWNNKAVAEICDWMRQALKDGAYDNYWIPVEQQTYQLKELCTLAALVASVLSIIPLASILMKTDFFQKVVQPMPDRFVNEGRSWWILAGINAAIGGVTFLVLPMLGMILGIILPIFNLVTGNGTLLWLLINALLCWVLFRRWYRKVNEKDNINYYDMGVSFDKEKKVYDWDILGKTLLLAVILFAYLYIAASISQSLLGVEFRYNWPIFKQFNGVRFIQFLIYLIPVLPFFLVNGGIFLFGQIRQKEYESFEKTQFIWWVKNCFAMEAGLIFVFLLQYVPMILLGTGPIFGPLPTAGLFLIFLMQTIPQFAVIFFIMTYFYQKTGKIYLGAIMGSILTTWIMAVASAIVW